MVWKQRPFYYGYGLESSMDWSKNHDDFST